MKKNLLLGAALGLALLANTAFAISADYLSGELEANPRYQNANDFSHCSIVCFL